MSPIMRYLARGASFLSRRVVRCEGKTVIGDGKYSLASLYIGETLSASPCFVNGLYIFTLKIYGVIPYKTLPVKLGLRFSAKDLIPSLKSSEVQAKI